MKAAYFAEHGGPEVFTWGELPDPVLGPSDVLIEVGACGVNNSDLRARQGTSRWRFNLPMVLGCEFAGQVVAVGELVDDIEPGQRATAYQQYSCGSCDRCNAWRPDLCRRFTVFGTDCWGGYAQLVRVPVRAVLPLGEGADYELAAAAQCTVSTAWHMTFALGRIQQGETVLVPSAAGGVASALVQCAKLAGARVVATVGSSRKAAAVRDLGADLVLSYRETDVTDVVREFTDGEGVQAVLDTVGGELFNTYLRLLGPDGRLVTCGAHAGWEATVDIIELFQHGWQILGFRVATPEEISASLSCVLAGQITVPIAATFPPWEAAEAHRYLASREHVGKVVLSRGGGGEQPGGDREEGPAWGSS